MKARIAAAFVGYCAVALGADDVPPWLKELTSISLPQYDRKVNAVVLLNEEQNAIGEGGKVTSTTRTAMKFLNRQGGDVRFSEQYDSASGKIRDFRAWMIAPTGKVKKFAKDEILDVACAENDVYNECRRRVVSGRRDAEAGAVFAYEAVVERQNFSNQLMFHFQNAVPVRLARFVVTAPPGWELKASSFNGAPQGSVASGGAYTWQMENLPAIEREEASPSFLTLAPWTGVNLLGKGRNTQSWTEAAKLLAELNDGVGEPNETIAAKARSLVAGAASEIDKIRAIGRFTQQVNYVSIQVNISKGGGYRPHPAPQVFQHLYGDCKDKANLTRAMLRAVGITAYPVAIYSGDRTHVTEAWPSLGSFNHAISAIRVGPETSSPAVLDHPKLGRLLFFDPTDPYTPVGHLPDHEQDSLALVGTGESGDLVRVPAARAEAGSRERTVEATLSADGLLSGSFVDKRTGEARSAALSVYRGISKTDYEKSVERWISRGAPGATATGIEIADSDTAFVVKAQFAAQRYAQLPQAGMVIFRAAPLRHAESLRLTEKTRKYPVVMDADALTETVRIAMPAGFKIDEMAAPVHLNSPFGKFDASWSVEGSTLVFRRKLEVQAQTVPAERYSELRKFLDAVSGAPETPVVLVK